MADLVSRYGQKATDETWIEESKNQTSPAHIKTADFWANSALFQVGILAYNTLRWMTLCRGNKILPRWETATIMNLSHPNGRKIDNWFSSTSNDSYKKNALQCPMAGIGICSEDKCFIESM